MRILVTAGNTLTPIDRVRCITNVFTGRTGTAMALEAVKRGHRALLLTSHPELAELAPRIHELSAGDRLEVLTYRTFDELHAQLAENMRDGAFDAVIHVAAVGDFEVAGSYVPADGTWFEPQTGEWRSRETPPGMLSADEPKVKSSHPELWLRLKPTPKLVDKFRREWGFRGILVKFKLEVGATISELESIARQSRAQSEADLLVANTLEGKNDWALIVDETGASTRIERAALAPRLIDAIEQRRGR